MKVSDSDSQEDNQTSVTQLPPLRVFGYGSLIWKGPPHYTRRIPGYITSHVRRFWQLSEDHRGTPESPGRVVTLIPRNQERPQGPLEKCWGVVYEIPPEYVEQVTDYLNIREINGYSLTNVTVQTDLFGDIVAAVFIGTPENPQFSPLEDSEEGYRQTISHIRKSRGPSGENLEYLQNLILSLKELHGAEEEGDAYIDHLERVMLSILE